jgi:hypothetical protein
MRKMKSISSWIGRHNLYTIKKEVIHIMNNREGMRSWIYIILMAVAAVGMVMLMSHTAQAGKTDPCANYSTTTDSDGDGFMDYEECKGILGFALDPQAKDLFYILLPASPSLIPTNPLLYVSNPSTSSAGGLGIKVHQVTSKQAPGRIVPSKNSQKAVQLTELSTMTGDLNLLGYSNTGTPNGLDLSTIYTQKIINFIKSVCGPLYGTPNCAASTGEYDGSPNDSLALTHKYVIHTVNHEVGHTLGPLAPAYDANYGGYHYAPGTNSIMDQSIYYKNSGESVIFYIGTTFSSADQAGVKLK